MLTWQQTKKMKRVMAVHSTFSLNWIFLSGFWISGKMLQKGLTNSKNLTAIKMQFQKPFSISISFYLRPISKAAFGLSPSTSRLLSFGL